MLFKLIFRAFNRKKDFNKVFFTTKTMMSAEYEPILKFWFGEDLSKLKSDSYQPNYRLWFSSNKETDDLIRNKFENTLNKAFNGEYNHWKNESRGSLSLVILFDQFSRNIYRGTPKMFSYDSKGVEIALELVNNRSKYDELSVIEKGFVIVCLEHSEDENVLLKCLDESKLLSETASTPTDKNISSSFHTYAEDHYKIIKQFGRYPHRNELLGRVSTPEEIKYLETNSPDFAQSVKKN